TLVMGVSPELLHEIEKLSSCDISDALVALGQELGGLIVDVKMFSPEMERGTHKIVGPAFTVRMTYADDPSPERPDKHFLDACPPGHIMLIQAPPGSVNSCWGGNLSLSAHSRKVLGTVVDGGTRDLLEHRELGYPVFARFHSTLPQSTFTRPARLSCPLTFQPAQSSHPFKPTPSTTVNPGDILVCDVDGCVAIPSDMISQVIDEAKKKRMQDQMLRYELSKGREWEKAQERVKARLRSGQL
ncbi:ribonuclease E inhibitor RraA/Dimethylmenaquinone methyltransferase, partial [Kockovaella imperatae]